MTTLHMPKVVKKKKKVEVSTMKMAFGTARRKVYTDSSRRAVFARAEALFKSTNEENNMKNHDVNNTAGKYAEDYVEPPDADEQASEPSHREGPINVEAIRHRRSLQTSARDVSDTTYRLILAQRVRYDAEVTQGEVRAQKSWRGAQT